MNSSANLSALFNQSRQSFTEFWNKRDERERKMLAAGALCVALGLFYVLLINPALSGRAQLNKNLPLLRQQVAQMQALSREAAALSGKPSAPLNALSKENIESSLARNGLKPQSVMLTGNYVKVQLAASSFSGMLNWLDDMQKTALLSVTDANIVTSEKPDVVNATLTLRQPKNE